MFITERLTNLIAPPSCLLCLTEGAVLCATCSASKLPATPDCCYVCLTKISNGALCERCQPTVPFNSVQVACCYAEVAEQLVHAFKFAHRRSCAAIMAKAMVAELPVQSKDVVVTHIPTAARRKRERGYDQAALLARTVAHELDLPHIPLLERIGNARQMGAASSARRTQLRGVFRPLKPYVIQNASILLVDDVLTTGSTLEAAARVLRTAGAASISAVVFAQAV